MTPEEEREVIRTAAAEYGVDWLFLLAIRTQENGRPGREFGVLSVPAPTYDAQLRRACESVRNALIRFAGNPLRAVGYAQKSARVAYSHRFIDSFGRRWAPSGAANDPDNLNRHWRRNVRAIYDRLIDQYEIW